MAARLKLNEDACRRLLIGLSQMGLLSKSGEQFSNTALAAYVTSSAAVHLGPLSMWGSLFYPMWGNLADAVREYGPRWQQTFGSSQRETFAYLYKDRLLYAASAGL